MLPKSRRVPGGAAIVSALRSQRPARPRIWGDPMPCLPSKAAALHRGRRDFAPQVTDFLAMRPVREVGIDSSLPCRKMQHSYSRTFLVTG